MNALICSAVAGRKYLTFFYDGAYRSVEPYCHGLGPTGAEVLKAYQVEGYVPSDTPQGWKLFEVARIQRMQILAATFHADRMDYNPSDPAIAKVCCHLLTWRLQPSLRPNPEEGRSDR